MSRKLAEAAKIAFHRALHAARESAGRRAKKRVLVIGDSHIRVFEHPIFLFLMPRTRFEVVYAAGGSAIGILNTKSKSGARLRFEEALEQGPWDRVLVNLGEVDTAYALWILVERRKKPISELLDSSVQAYLTFLETLRPTMPLIVLAATLPTLDDPAGTQDEVLQQRAQVTATQRERTELTLEFNRRIAAWCATHAVPYIDTAPDALGPDGLVKKAWTNTSRRDHHYSRPVYARWMLRALRPIL